MRSSLELIKGFVKERSMEEGGRGKAEESRAHYRELAIAGVRDNTQVASLFGSLVGGGMG
jgi:hypothetical protein